MTQLRVDGSALAQTSAAMTRAAAGVRLNADRIMSAVDVLGSVGVAQALQTGVHQQSLRAAIAAETLATIGSAPGATVGALSDADAALAAGL